MLQNNGTPQVNSPRPDGHPIGRPTEPSPLPAANIAANDLGRVQQNHERWALPLIGLFVSLGGCFGHTIPRQINDVFHIVNDNNLIPIQLIGTVLGAAIGVCTVISVRGFPPE